MKSHHFCPICGLLCGSRPFKRCAAFHRCHDHCLAGMELSLCPHCGLELTENLVPKPFKVDESISGMITLPNEHYSAYMYRSKD